MSVTFDPATQIPDLAGKSVVVTGGNAGLGAATVLAIAAHGPAHIYMTARRRDQAEQTAARVRETSPAANITIVDLDLASLKSVRAGAERILADGGAIDVLILNAGIAGVSSFTTQEGYEGHFGTNHLGHALLTQLLLPKMLERAAGPGADVRIVVVSSEAHRIFVTKNGIEFGELKSAMGDYWNMKLYGQSKLANVLFANSLAAKYPAIKSVSVHPGVVNTSIYGKATGWGMLQSIVKPIVNMLGLTADDGARGQLWAGFGEGVVSGAYYEPVGKTGKESKLAKDAGLAERLWDWTTEELQAHGGAGWPATKST